MFKFVGVTYTDFTPEGGKDRICGYTFHFSEYPADLPITRGIGGQGFKYFIRPDAAVRYGLNSPDDMAKLAKYIDTSVTMSFTRLGKLDYFSWPDVPTSSKFLFDNVSKPSKL